METKLKPNDNPSFVHKLGYLYSKFMFGKILTPQKIMYSRLPFSFTLFSGRISALDKKLKLPSELVMLIRQRVAQINTCSFCIDIGEFIAVNQKLYSDKFTTLSNYQSSHLFTEAEKAALTFSDELTKDKHVSSTVFEAVKTHYSERQIIEMAWLVATEHYYNLMNLAFDLHSDNLCALVRPQPAGSNVLQ